MRPMLAQEGLSDNENAQECAAYQVFPLDYYVKDFFLAKALMYVLRYKDDSDLYEIATDEAITLYKLDRDRLEHHKARMNDQFKQFFNQERYT